MSYLNYKWNLWKLERFRRDARKAYAKKAAQYRADKTKTRDDFQSLDADEYFEGRMIDEQVSLLYSDRLLDQAAHYDIEPPQDEASWQYAEDGEKRFLSPAARATLRVLIDPEKKRDFDDWARWIPLIIGLVGALTGLVAIFKK